MTGSSAEGWSEKALSGFISILGSAGLTGLAAISTDLRPALLGLFGVCNFAIFLVYQHYFGVLGAGTGTSKRAINARQDYEKLRGSLAAHGRAVDLYTRWLNASLNAIDCFFGDTDRKSRGFSPLPRLVDAAPLWTMPAFDRCLVLALIYPLVTIFLFWAAFGERGDAEVALGLTDNLPIAARCLTLILILAAAFITKYFMRAGVLKYCAWIVVMGIFCGVLVLGLYRFANGVGVGAVAGGVAVAVALAVALAGFGPFAGASVITIAIAYAVGGAFLGVYSALFVAAIGAIIAIPVANSIAPRPAGAAPSSRLQTGFLCTFFVVTTIVSIVAAKPLSNLGHWPDVGGPILLFLGLLTLLNAPFDWISLGLTRLLLRRGLERQGYWPLGLALLDVALAVITILLLVVVMVAGVLAFNYMTELGGGQVVLHLDRMFDEIAAHPAAHKFWWVYALLFSTMVPSLFNLIIGGASLTRGVPIMRTYLYDNMPAGGNIPKYRQRWMAVLLTIQSVIGGALGGGALIVLLGSCYFVVTHWLGFTLLDLARLVAGLSRTTPS